MFNLPDYRYKPLRAFTACGFIANAENAPEEDIELEAKVLDRFDEPVWVRLCLNKNEKLNRFHFHVDTARESWFEGTPPQSNAQISEIDRVFEQYQGHSIQSSGAARFEVPIGALAEDNAITLLLGISITKGEESVTLSSARFTVRGGSPVESIDWEKDGESIKAIVKSENELTIGQSYLTELLSPLNTAFRAFVIGD